MPHGLRQNHWRHAHSDLLRLNAPALSDSDGEIFSGNVSLDYDWEGSYVSDIDGDSDRSCFSVPRSDSVSVVDNDSDRSCFSVPASDSVSLVDNDSDRSCFSVPASDSASIADNSAGKVDSDLDDEASDALCEEMQRAFEDGCSAGQSWSGKHSAYIAA